MISSNNKDEDPETDLRRFLLECKPHFESMHHKFVRIGHMVELGHPLCVLKLTDVTIPEGLALYGLGLQGVFGDNNNKKPDIFDQLEYQKWEAYNAQRGKSKNDAKKEFLNTAIPILNRLGFSTEDP